MVERELVERNNFLQTSWFLEHFHSVYSTHWLNTDRINLNWNALEWLQFQCICRNIKKSVSFTVVVSTRGKAFRKPDIEMNASQLKIKQKLLNFRYLMQRPMKCLSSYILKISYINGFRSSCSPDLRDVMARMRHVCRCSIGIYHNLIRILHSFLEYLILAIFCSRLLRF